MTSFSRACDRYGVSDRAAAHLASAAFGALQSPGEKATVVDRSKVRRERQQLRTSLQNEEPQAKIVGVFFDGTDDLT